MTCKGRSISLDYMPRLIRIRRLTSLQTAMCVSRNN
ncbi:hypothetical protein EVA_21318 [gut metagenome]|uniref:Uncharacterized protein n=1 Tax=gut metagenome TaxID=749906 RepID=J9FLW8_9ZZZZ